MSAGIVESLDRQRRAFEAMGSPFYASALVEVIADYAKPSVVARFFAADPARVTASAPALRLFGALHYCALDGRAPSIARHLPSCGGDGDAVAFWSEARGVLAERDAEIGVLYADTPQTNEVGRSTLLLAGLLEVVARTGKPIRLFDVGASAGLNARVDAYRYEGDGWTWGDADSPLVLKNRTRSGKPRHLGESLHVVERRGCDARPLDVSSAHDRLRLRSFVWPDQLERLARLDAALEIAQQIPMPVDRADLFAWIDERAQPCSGTATVVMHSIVAEHLSEQGRAQLEALMHALGAKANDAAPFAWLRMEFGSKDWAETLVTLWPNGEETSIATSDGHAQGIVWAA